MNNRNMKERNVNSRSRNSASIGYNRVAGETAEALYQIIAGKKAAEVSVTGENSGGVVVSLKLPGSPSNVVRGFIPRSLLAVGADYKVSGAQLSVMIKRVEHLHGKTQFIASHREGVVDQFFNSLTIGVATYGRVSRAASNNNGQFGWFISLAYGIDGLLHASENDVELEVGDDVAVEIISLDAVALRIGLSTRISNVRESQGGRSNLSRKRTEDRAENNWETARESERCQLETVQRNRSRACVGSLSKLGDFFPQAIIVAPKASNPTVQNWLERMISAAVEELSAGR